MKPHPITLLSLPRLLGFISGLIMTASGGVILSNSAPTTEILETKALGNTDTSIFPLTGSAPSPIAGNNNHARGQAFSLGDGAGTAFEITAITIQKNIAATFNNDALTLRIFEGTQAQWNSGTGHTATDTNFYKGTTVTPLYSEVFTLDGSIGDDQFVSLELATPLVVNENSDFGFFLTYDPSSGTSPDRFRHLEAGLGGRLSVTTTSHGTTPTRSMNHFIQGTAISAGGTLALINPSATEITASGATLGATISGGSGITEHGTTFWATGGTQGDNSSTLGVVSTVPSTFNDARSGMNPGTVYSFESYATNASEGQIFSATVTFLTEPSVAQDLVVSPASSTSINLSWSDPASAAGSVVVVRESSAPGNPPTDGTLYNGDLNYGDGDPVGGGFVVYSGTSPGSPITVTVPGGEYFVAVYSYADSAGQPRNYNDHDSPPTGNASAMPALQLASPFQDRMVLQRDKPMKVWGNTQPNTAVSVSMNGVSVMNTSDSTGAWQADLPAASAGGSYSLSVTSGGESQTVNDVLIGDVWFCFGQSNFVYTLNQMGSWHTSYENDIIANDNIRCLKITQDAALTEEETAGMNWLANSTAGTWSAVPSVFAHQLHSSTGVPVAIIWAAWGSSSIEGWMPQEMTGQFPHFEEMMTLYQSIGEYRSGTTVATRATNGGYSSNLEMITDLTTNGWSSNSDDIFIRTRPNIIYNKMVHPIRNYSISGFLWYQGEANAGSAIDSAQYRFTLPSFITEYRERFGQGDLPFLGVQLPSFNQANWPLFRESQDQMETLDNAYAAITIDTGLANNIHPTDKEPIGIRLARLARKFALNENIEALSPRFDTMTITGNSVELSFINDAGLATDDGNAPATFEIAGANQVYHAATSSSVSRRVVTISSTSVSNPVAVRYAWSPAPVNQVNLVNDTGLPVAPFRTDSWPISGVPTSAPHSNDDAFTTPENQTLNVPASGVLGNDFDLNFDDLEANMVTPPSSGSVTLLSDGSFSYVPQADFFGTDSFVYHSSELGGGLSSANATVTITVEEVTSAYETWQTGTSWNPGDDQSASGDPDGDSIANLLEFALGLDPLVASFDGLPTLTASTGGAAFYDFNLAQPTMTYEVLVSTDLETWSEPAFATLTGGSTTPVSIPSSESDGGRLFVRLRVSE
ncbi:MAG: sialate O-acetylesterase [Akkermansiaceae bacterium]